MNQYLVEFHSHTNHSDAKFTVSELHLAADNFGYDGLILTDHNSFSGFQELSRLAKESGLTVLSGIEWTTYFGHMLVIGADEIIDWREATPDTIDHWISKIKSVNGLIGIAHPFDIGSPICTGCHWDFNVQDWSQVDFIEIFNGTSAHQKPESKAAYEMWSSLLDDGERISCSAGRDWHYFEGDDQNPAFNYLEMSGELSPGAIKNAINQGNYYVSLAPKMVWKLKQGNETYDIGDLIDKGKYESQITITDTDIEFMKQFKCEIDHYVIIHNGKIIYQDQLLLNQTENIQLDLAPGYVRLEVIGFFKDSPDSKIILSNPIYIQ